MFTLSAVSTQREVLKSRSVVLHWNGHHDKSEYVEATTMFFRHLKHKSWSRITNCNKMILGKMKCSATSTKYGMYNVHAVFDSKGKIDIQLEIVNATYEERGQYDIRLKNEHQEDRFMGLYYSSSTSLLVKGL